MGIGCTGVWVLEHGCAGWGWARPVQEQNLAIFHRPGAGTGRGEGGPTRARLRGGGALPGPSPARYP